jgi:GTP:adenosylcobinamide-phosphate guanylyltransferase
MNLRSAEGPDANPHSCHCSPRTGATKPPEAVDAVVVCGGLGTRMGSAMESAKCKSLLPVLGLPCLAYVLRALERICCSRCILSVDRRDIFEDVERVGRNSGVPYVMHLDSGRGPTAVAQEASFLVSTPRFLVLYGHQIVFPSHLRQMIAADADFVATVYEGSSEGVRKVATLNSERYCISLRHGSQQSPAGVNEVYLDKPYVLQAEAIRNSSINAGYFDPHTPADSDLRPHTILRYTHSLYTVPAAFRHEFHYASELEDVAKLARVFGQDHCD